MYLCVCVCAYFCLHFIHVYGYEYAGLFIDSYNYIIFRAFSDFMYLKGELKKFHEEIKKEIFLFNTCLSKWSIRICIYNDSLLGYHLRHVGY